ncbi:MAG: radical SAM protein, partial [Desulfobacterales bacterium]
MPLCDSPHILLINPWIHDFAAYDFWAKPMGLLSIASMLRHHGIQVSYIDCLDRFHPRAPKTDPGARYGRGPYYKTRIPKPAGLQDVPRHFSRYGIKPQWFKDDLRRHGRPDLVLVTSLMTYWYPGIQETIGITRSIYPRTPIVLGGIYARLYPDHARNSSGADYVADGPAEKILYALIRRFTGFSVTPAFDPEVLDEYPYPALDLQTILNYVPLLTSRGCPFQCAYCASRFLEPKRLLRNPAAVVEEIKYWQKDYGCCDFILYDDAFLMDADRHAIPILEGILQTGTQVRFHTPNAVHIRGIDPQTARLMFETGFTTLRLGLETAEFNHREEIDVKVSEHEFKRAVNCLRDAGFKKNQIGAYLLVGLPGQKLDTIKHSIDVVKQIGVTPVP